MNILTLIYFVAAIVIGMFSGVTLEYFIDVKLIRDLETENRILREKVVDLDKRLKQLPKESTQVIEIVDRRTGKTPDFSQRW